MAYFVHWSPFIFSSFQDTSEGTEFSLFICMFSAVCHFMYLHFLALSTKSTVFRQIVVCDHVAIKSFIFWNIFLPDVVIFLRIYYFYRGSGPPFFFVFSLLFGPIANQGWWEQCVRSSEWVKRCFIPAHLIKSLFFLNKFNMAATHTLGNSLLQTAIAGEVNNHFIILWYVIDGTIQN